MTMLSRGRSLLGKEMKKKREELPKLVKLKDAINLIDQNVSLLGIVIERREPKLCRNYDWICTLRIIDDTYTNPGLIVNVFSNKREELPRIKNHEDMILFTRVKMKAFEGGERVNAACNRLVSSFALYEETTGGDFVCYQCTSNFHGEEQYKSYIDYLGNCSARSSRVDKVLQITSNQIDGHTIENFTFLREIKEGKCFNLLCKILHVDEDMNTIFVWDGTDAPPAPILAKTMEEDKTFIVLSIHTLLSREILVSFPTIGTILRVSQSYHQFKVGESVKLYNILCKVEKGCWVGEVTDSTKVHLAQDDPLIEKITRIYDKRKSSKLGHTPFWSFPSPPGLTETYENSAPFVTLMDIITFPKVTHKFRCIVRVVSATPWKIEDICSNENRVLLILEDPTATIEAFLCDKEAEHFWGKAFEDKERLREKWNELMGMRESSKWVTPPWIECCIFSYYTDKANPWKTRSYRIFGTRLLV